MNGGQTAGSDIEHLGEPRVLTPLSFFWMLHGLA